MPPAEADVERDGPRAHCSYELAGDQLICPQCGHERRAPPGLRADQVLRVCPRGPRAGKRGLRTADRGPPPGSGPGTELKSLLAQLGVEPGPKCDCRGKADQMDRWGVEGCRANFETIVAWMRDGQGKWGWRDKLAAAAKAVRTGLAFELKWSDPFPDLVRRAIDLAEAKRSDAAAAAQQADGERLRAAFQHGRRIATGAQHGATREIFVVGHEPERLASIADRPFLRKVFLPDLEPAVPLKTPKAQLAENLIYLSDALAASGAEYIGIAAASWNHKYAGRGWKGLRPPRVLRVEQLDQLALGQLALSPKIVHAAHPNDDPAVIEGLESFIPGLRDLVFEALAELWPAGGASPAVLAGRHASKGLLANNFVAHRDVVLDLRDWMRRALSYLDGRYGPTWPLRHDRVDEAVTCRLPAYVGEALSICYFALRSDLVIRQIPSFPL